MFLILIILSRGSDVWGVLAALTWVGFSFFLLVDSIQYFHKLPSSITADLLQLAMLLTPGVKHLFLFIYTESSIPAYHKISGDNTTPNCSFIYIHIYIYISKENCDCDTIANDVCWNKLLLTIPI